MQLLKTKTNKGKFFYVDGKRVSEMRYLTEMQKGIDRGTYNSAHTVTANDGSTRHFTSV